MKDAGAKANQAHGQTAPNKTLVVNSSEALNPINTRQEVSKITGVGEQTVQRTKKIIEKADDKTKDKLRNGDVSINKTGKA